MTLQLSDAVVSTVDAPFAPPPVIVLDLPAPISVNKLRRVDWLGNRRSKTWRIKAEPLVHWSHSKRRGQPKCMTTPAEILIVLADRCNLDPDNGIKMILDYLVLIEVIQDDSKRFVRRVIVEYGDAPEGCRVHVRGLA